MIQELLGAASGAAGLIGAGERRNIPITTTASIFETTVPSPNSPSLSPSPSPSSPTTTIPASSTTPTNQTPTTHPENLRCPRCDSSNTKFCYYNNYNLTQPRHFCKTCRRYWTKGGALRNVPIGGGCRKNKTTSVSSTSVGKSGGSSNKMKTIASEIGRSGGFGNMGFDHHHHDQLISSSPIMWASPQNSHILALLRAAQNPNPNNPSSVLSNSVKEEGGLIGTHFLTEPTLGLDSISQVPSSVGLCSPFWKNSNQNQAQQNGFSTVGDAQNSGIQELYQRLRSTTSNYYSTDTSAAAIVLSNVAANSSNSNSSSTILESAPVVGGSGEFGYCWNNPTFSSWSDLSTTSGAYP